MKKLSVGDLAYFRYDESLPDFEEEDYNYDNPIVEVVEVFLEEYLKYDYFVKFPNGKVYEVSEDELEPLFTI